MFSRNFSVADSIEEMSIRSEINVKRCRLKVKAGCRLELKAKRRSVN